MGRKCRISDVITLSKDHVQGNRLSRKATKGLNWIRVEFPAVVLEALEQLPHPKSAAQDCKLFFSSGNASLRSLGKGRRTHYGRCVRAFGR